MKPLRVGLPPVTLVVAPHSDDETIGAYGLICRLRAARLRVQVLVVSDGAASHPTSKSWPGGRLVAERQRETLRAMRQLKVMASDVRFLGLPDGSVGCEPAHAQAIGRAARHTANLALIVAPAPDDAHPDHRAVAAALARTVLPGVRRLSYLVWGKARRGRPLVLGLAQANKRAAILRYRTQAGLIIDDPAGFTIAPHELSAFARPAEILREERRCARSR
jgi:LmbE family N-acetylglucosaminyl deacetylase